MALLQAAVLGLIALIITPGYLFYFDVTPKVVVLLAGAAAVLACGAVPRPAGKLFSWLSLLSLLSLAFSTALSANPALSLFGTNWRRFGAVTQAGVLLFAWLVASHTAGRPERVRVILRVVAASGIVAAAYGIAQYLGWDPILPAAAYHVGEGTWTIVRPPGTLGYSSYFATWLLLTVFLSLALASSEGRAAWRWMALAAAGMALAAMLLTGTRAAILGLLAGAAVWLYYSGFRFTRRMALVTALIALAGTGFYYSPPGGQLRSRARWFAEDPWGGARLQLWRDSLRMSKGRLAAGYGPEVFTAAFPRFESKELATAYPDFAYESPHNIYLDALVAQGIPGFLILCGLSAAGFAAAWRLKTTVSGALAAALAAGIVCQQFTVFTLPTAVLFFTTLAAAVGLGAQPSPPRRNAAFATAAALVVIALLYVAVRLTVADCTLALSQRGVEAGDVRAATAQYARYERWRLPGTSSDLWYSRAWIALAKRSRNPMVQFQALAQAGAAALRATNTAEDPFNAWYHVAALYGSRNDAADAESSLRAAIAARPNWFKPHWTLAQVLRVEARLPEAESEAALAAELNGGKNPEVARTLAEIRALRANVRVPPSQW